MVIAVILIVSHTMILVAITHVVVAERKCALWGGLVPDVIMVG